MKRFKKIFLFIIISIIVFVLCHNMINASGENDINSELVSSYRKMKYLDRGLVVIGPDSSGKNFLSWRLLGTESLENQAFDIYKNGNLIYTTAEHDATQWNDCEGSITDTYQVVKKGENPKYEKLLELINKCIIMMIIYVDISI